MGAVLTFLFLAIVGVGVASHHPHKEVKKQPNFPESHFFNYDTSKTFYPEAYNLSIKIKKDNNGLLNTINSIDTVVYSPEPQFHYFSFSDPDSKQSNKFVFKMQLIPQENETTMKMSYKLKISKSYKNGKEDVVKEVAFQNKTTIQLYDQNSDQYENYYVNVNVKNVKKDKYFYNPEKAHCDTDYCKILKNNTIKLVHPEMLKKKKDDNNILNRRNDFH